MPSEAEMVKDIYDLLIPIGFARPRYRIYVDSKIADSFPPGTFEHGLPLYLDEIHGLPNDRSRQVAQPDLIVVDTDERMVELIAEFETDLNPKNLAANFLTVFMSAEFKPEEEFVRYTLDVRRSRSARCWPEHAGRVEAGMDRHELRGLAGDGLQVAPASVLRKRWASPMAAVEPT